MAYPSMSTENCQGQDRNRKSSLIDNSNINEDNSVAMMNITGLGTGAHGTQGCPCCCRRVNRRKIN